ncbi:hypothetical protein BDV96DRAFT_568132 [Lophiotrema nucula]|uniref:Uncharacterized protein n=1 Tax=Lophiotrema nucula TaxID=690887 RepID=A0A6A5ZJI3_9PLEO|nr:hypothetical protein BDV96DRAFT_568132 [Lophiotrema nucula]
MSVPFPFTIDETITSPYHIADAAFVLKHGSVLVSSLASSRLRFHSACLPYTGPQLTLSEAYHAFQMLRKIEVDIPNKTDLKLEDVMNALYLGLETAATARGGADAGRGDAMGLKYFVVFPHLRKDIRKDTGLLEKWQKRVLIPAWERAWEEALRLPRDGSSLQSYEDYSSNAVAGQSDLRHADWPVLMEDSRVEALVCSSLDNAWTQMKQAVAEDESLHSLRDMLLIAIVKPAPMTPANDVNKIVDSLDLGTWLRADYVHHAHFKIVSQGPKIPSCTHNADDEEKVNTARNRTRILERMRNRKRDRENAQRMDLKKQKSNGRSRTTSAAPDESSVVVDLTNQ